MTRCTFESRGRVATSRLRSAAAPGVLAAASSPAASSHCSPSRLSHDWQMRSARHFGATPAAPHARTLRSSAHTFSGTAPALCPALPRPTRCSHLLAGRCHGQELR
eukprot:3287911-Prymnesium_polylepis.1